MTGAISIVFSYIRFNLLFPNTRQKNNWNAFSTWFITEEAMSVYAEHQENNKKL